MSIRNIQNITFDTSVELPGMPESHTISHPRFIRVPVRRGFEEIRALYGFLGLYEAYICGGYVRYMVSPRVDVAPPSDIDIFCADETVFGNLFSEFSARNLLEIRNNSSWAVTFDGSKFNSSLPIQLIKPRIDPYLRTFGSMEEILGGFSFTVTRCGLITQYTALTDTSFMQDEKEKLLNCGKGGCGNPLSALIHSMKYIKKGYNWGSIYDMYYLLDKYAELNSGQREMVKRYSRYGTEGL